MSRTRGAAHWQPPFGVVATYSPWLSTTPGVRDLVRASRWLVAPDLWREAVDVILGSPDDGSEPWAMRQAVRHGIPYIRILRGCPLRAGIRGPSEPVMSLVFDPVLFEEAGAASSLQRAIDSGVPVSPPLLDRAASAVRVLNELGVEIPDAGLARADRSIEEFFALVYVAGARFSDPETGQPCELEDALSLLALQRRTFALNAGTTFCFGFTYWKRTFVRAYLRSPRSCVVFVNSARQAERAGFGPGARLLVWGVRETEELARLAQERGVPIWRMEDGFLRSVGLGTDLTVPASLVVDSRGIYFDPNQPSDLETILQQETFSDDELARARALRTLIVQNAISKYNVGDARRGFVRPAHAKVILVPGQVQDDASIQRGTLDVSTNLDLLRAVRASDPHAYVVYKPHPDVVLAGRVGAIGRDEALEFADEVVTDIPLPACLGNVDEVHTMTSLVGFEALLRGLRVVCYGQPFYSGWGLTVDRHPHVRRTRRLSLDQLTAGVLLRYPRYLSATTRLFTTPEVVVRQLRAQMAKGSTRSGASRWRREVRRALHVVWGALDVP